MFLSSVEIRAAIASGMIRTDPATRADDFRPFGIRLRLGNELIEPVSSTVALDGSRGEAQFRRLSLDESGYFVIHPNSLYLGTTDQSFLLDSCIAGFIDGRSTVARLGLMVHVSSQIFDGASMNPRTITLELFNIGPHTLLVKPGEAIGMLSFFRSAKASEDRLVHAQYRDQTEGPLPPRLVGW